MDDLPLFMSLYTHLQSYLGKCRELDSIYQSKVSEEALAIQEKINKGDPVDDISEDLRMVGGGVL